MLPRSLLEISSGPKKRSYMERTLPRPVCAPEQPSTGNVAFAYTIVQITPVRGTAIMAIRTCISTTLDSSSGSMVRVTIGAVATTWASVSKLPTSRPSPASAPTTIRKSPYHKTYG